MGESSPRFLGVIFLKEIVETKITLSCLMDFLGSGSGVMKGMKLIELRSFFSRLVVGYIMLSLYP